MKDNYRTLQSYRWGQDFAVHGRMNSSNTKGLYKKRVYSINKNSLYKSNRFSHSGNENSNRLYPIDVSATKWLDFCKRGFNF